LKVLIEFLLPFKKATKFFEETPCSKNNLIIPISGMMPVIIALIKHCSEFSKKNSINSEMKNFVLAKRGNQ
jgi:hypothetical protein